MSAVKPREMESEMKKSVFFLVLILSLLILNSAAAQENVLPQLGTVAAGLPDPAEAYGGIGSLYQADYYYGDRTYDTYLYPRPESADAFLSAYMNAATDAGFTAEQDALEGYNILRVYPSGDRNAAALLFYDYQGYMLFMVPTDMDFTLGSETDGSADPAELIDLGLESIRNEDYEAAVRYLIRAAGSYIRNPEPLVIQPPAVPAEVPTETPVPDGPKTYVVEDGDTCWGIAVDKFGVNFELFMMVNGLTACNIGIGDEVIIPGADQQMPTMTPIPLDQYTMGQQIQYVVEMNDSYNDIAAKFNTTLVSIQQLNNVNVYTGFPQYGQVLTIAVNLVTPTPLPEPTATPVMGTLQP